MRRDERSVSGPDGREWAVRVYRFRRPPWRTVGTRLEEDIGCFGGILLLPVLAVVTFFTVLVIPLGIFLAEVAAEALRALVSRERFVEAEHAGPAASRMTWRTHAEHAEAVLDQVARQLELGYERVQPHNAEFLGFG